MTKNTKPRSCVFKSEHGPPSTGVWRHLGKNWGLKFFSIIKENESREERSWPGEETSRVKSVSSVIMIHSPASHGASYGIYMGLLKMFSSDEYQLHQSLQSQCKDGLLYNFIKLYSKSATIVFQNRNIRLRFLKKISFGFDFLPQIVKRCQIKQRHLKEQFIKPSLTVWVYSEYKV